MRYATFFLLCLAASPGRAQAPARFSWEDCVATAIRNNPELASARHGREAGQASYRGSFNGVLPRLSLSNSYGDSDGASGLSRWGAQASANLSLFDMGRFASIRTSGAALKRAEAGLRQASSSVRFDLRQAYLLLLFAQDNIEVSRRIEVIRHRGADMVTLRYNSGRESKGNMLRARAQLLQAKVDLAQAERELITARAALSRQLGLDVFQAVSASGTLAAPVAPPRPQDRGLISSRPDMAVQEALLRGAEADVASASSDLWPSLSASYTRSVAGRREFPSSNYGWSLSGVLSYPLLSGGPTAVYHGRLAAKRSLERAQEDFRAAWDQAWLDVQSTWSDFARASSQERVQRALLEAARQRSEEADIRYASGLLSYDNWEIIGSDRVSQERQALQARLNAAAAEADWDRALGRGLGE